MARRSARARVRGHSLTTPEHGPLKAGPYFDALYEVLAASPTHARIGREALGDAFVGQLGYAGEWELLRLAEVAGISSRRRTLDLCCGNGGVAAWYASSLGADVVGADSSRAGLLLGARAGGRPEAAALAVADLRALPFARASFDAIVCIDGFGAAFPLLAAETLRLLRPDGGLGMLLSLRTGGVQEVVQSFRHAGAAHSFAEDVTAPATVLMRRWLDAYRRHAREHIAEVGERYHFSIVDEIVRLLREYATGQTQRALIGVRGA